MKTVSSLHKGASVSARAEASGRFFSNRFDLKRILFAIIFCSSVLIGSAQDDENERYNGIRGGYQWSTLVKNSNAGGSLSNWYVGYVRQVRLIPIFRLESGVEYMRAGGTVFGDRKIELQYVGVPLQAVLKLGPFMGLLGITANWKVAEDQHVNGVKVDVNGSNQSNTFDWDASVGLALKIFFLQLETRYYWGLNEVNSGYKNQYFQLGARINFGR